MIIDIITLFPKMFKGPFSESLIFRAQKKGIVKIKIHNLRDWAKSKHNQVDDSPYGGGAGMVLKVDVIDRAVSAFKKKGTKIILLTPQGKKFDQKKAKKLAKNQHLILICGHYEGFDERIRKLVDEEISIGDYILTGGELPAMIIADAVVRLLPGVVGKNESLKHESFENNLLDYPVYTKPEIYKKWRVPEVLLSGNHKKIAEWRGKEAQKRTKTR
ncbi:MAG: tRNA (guanosine(37)-N1)-methyltransferase TrmD, partial [Candidatus Berkelbacteria bacterium]|nr:tRNA (guanosine(37)-N1)-methyltransferase TrmD [Candidatus Berkelbacteria bacterium]